MRVTSKLSSRVRTSIIEGMGEEGKFSLSLFFFAEQSSATRRTDRKRRRFFAMAVVAGIQWEDRFYSGLNPVMPARVASRSHSRTRLRTRARVCVSVCRSLAPPRNGRCRCRCLSLSLFFLPFFSLPFSLSFISYCFFSTFFFPLSILYLSLSLSFHLSTYGLPCRSASRRTTFGLFGTKEERGGKFRKAKKIRVGRILLHGRGRKDRARGEGSVNQRGGIFLASITTHCPAARPIPVKKIGLRVGGREISRPCVFITDSISFVL